MDVERLGLSWFFMNCYALFKSRGFSLAYVIAHVCYLQRKSVFVRPLPNADFLSSDWFMRLLWGQPFSFKKIFSNVVVTSNSSCVFLYLFSSVNISPVRFVLHLQDWWCVGKRETSFPVNKLWLIYLPPSLWPLTLSKLVDYGKKIKLLPAWRFAWNSFKVKYHWGNICYLKRKYTAAWYRQGNENRPANVFKR